MRYMSAFMAVILAPMLAWTMARDETQRPATDAPPSTPSSTSSLSLAPVVVVMEDAVTGNVTNCIKTEIDTIRAREGEVITWDLWHLCAAGRTVSVAFAAGNSPCDETSTAQTVNMQPNYDRKSITCTIKAGVGGTPTNPNRFHYVMNGPYNSVDPEIEVPPPGSMRGISVPLIVLGGLVALFVGLGLGVGLSRWRRGGRAGTPGAPRPVS